jgi:putative ABC transport system permease protein
MSSLAHDIRQAVRSLSKAPRLAALVVLTLAAAVAVTTAVFSVVHGVLLAPLGFASPDRLVLVRARDPHGRPMPLSPQDLLDVQRRNHSFTALAGIDAGRTLSLTQEAGPAVRLSAARVGAAFFTILGVQPELGRFFEAGADSATAQATVVLSHAAWDREFGGDPAIIGKFVVLDARRYEVIGVASPNLTFPREADVWYPAVWASYEIGDVNRGFHSIDAIGRLSAGVTLESASRDLASIAGDIAHAFPAYDANIGSSAIPLRTYLVGDVERPLWTLFGAVAFVLLIACANVGNLLLVRAFFRESELAIRIALGATRRRLLQQSVAEGLVLAGAGAGIGIILAGWIVDVLARFGPANLPRLHEIRLDATVVAFAVGAAVAAGIAFGVLPGLQLRLGDVSQSLRSGARGIATGGRLRTAIVVAELALGTVLIVGAGLLVRSFTQLITLDPGFKAEHLIVFDAALGGKKYEYDAATIQFTDEVERRLAGIPGTRSVAIASYRPIDASPGFDASTSYTIDGAPRPAKGSEPVAALLPVSPSFFSTMGMTVARGRAFTDAENRLDVAPVIVVNQALANRAFPGQNPIGRHLTFGISHGVSADPADTVRARGEIVGVVNDVRQVSLAATPAPAAYFPYHTLPIGQAFVVRTDADPASVEHEIARQVHETDPNVPIYGLETMSDALSASVAQPRFYTYVLSAFAAIALLLALLGVYGVVAYTVGQRTREFGIRVALGATVTNIIGLVVRRALVMGSVGIALGIIGAAVLTRGLQSLLFHVSSIDPLSYVIGALTLLAAVFIGSWIPARRISAVDPLVAIRAE